MNRNFIIRITVYAIIAILVCYFIGNKTTVRAEDRVYTLQDKINSLSIRYNVDSELVKKIIKCESSMYGSAINHNIDSDGKIWSSDWGLLQINDYYHKSTMEKLGLDITDEYDSLKYGIMLLAQEGTKPWKASQWCWNK